MAITSFSVSLARGLVSPKCGDGYPRAFQLRSFATISCELDLHEPKNRWSGLTHGGLSQLLQHFTSIWQIGPQCSSYEKRCALTGFLFTANIPYRDSFLLPLKSRTCSDPTTRSLFDFTPKSFFNCHTEQNKIRSCAGSKYDWLTGTIRRTFFARL